MIFQKYFKGETLLESQSKKRQERGTNDNQERRRLVCNESHLCIARNDQVDGEDWSLHEIRAQIQTEEEETLRV